MIIKTIYKFFSLQITIEYKRKIVSYQIIKLNSLLINSLYDDLYFLSIKRLTLAVTNILSVRYYFVSEYIH